MKKKISLNFKKKYFIIVGIITLAILGFAFFKTNLSGNVILKMDADYHEGENLDGVLKLSLNKGEFIPASSKVIFETAEQRQEFILEDILFEQPVEGTYYIQGKNFSGQGMGYGSTGIEKTYPEISFAFNVYSESEKINETKSEEEKTEKEKADSDEQVEKIIKIINETKTDKETNKSDEKIEKINKEENKTKISETSGETEEVDIMKDKESEEDVEEEVEEEPTITGRIISSISMSFASLLHMTPTGQVTLNLEASVHGKVSADSPFNYNLEKGQTAEVVPGSVTVNSETLSDDSINFEVSDNTVFVSTGYSRTEEGSDVHYLEDEFQIFEINLSAINLNFTKGDLTISFIYDDEEIISLSTVLQECKINKDNKSNLTEVPKISPQNLTDDEKQILIQKFGNVSVKTTRSEILNKRLIRNYKIGNYELTASYDYNPDIADSLKEQMEKDKLNFLRDLIKADSEEENSQKIIPEFIGDSNF